MVQSEGNESKSLKTKLEEMMAPQRGHYFEFGNQQQLIDNRQGDLHPEDVVLLKGSHGMHLEKVLAALSPAENED